MKVSGGLQANGTSGVPAARRRAVVVTGMHRSGAAVLARVFNLLGAGVSRSLGSTADSAADAVLPEPPEIVRLHDDLFRDAGLSWQDISTIEPSWFGSELVASYAERLAALVEQEYADAPLFVVNDPRISRLVPLWLDVLQRAEIGAGFAIVVRNPLEVAASLKARDNLSPPKSLLLWLRHVLDVERGTRGQPRAVVSYEDLLWDWRGVVGRASESLGLGWPRLSHETELEIDRFLSAEQRHHAVTPQEIEVRADVAAWVKDVYSSVSELARGERDEATAMLDHVSEQLERADKTYGVLLVERDFVIRELKGELAARDAELEARRAERETALEDAVAEAEARAEELRRARARLEERAELLRRADAARSTKQEELDRARVELDAQAKQLERVAAERNARAEKLQETRTELDAKLRELRQAMTESQAQSAKLERITADRERKTKELQRIRGLVRELRTSLEKSRAQVAELERSNAELDADVDEARRDLADRNEEIEGLRHDVDRLEQDRDNLRRQLVEQAGEVEELQRRTAAGQAKLAELERTLAKVGRTAADGSKQAARLRWRLVTRRSELELRQAEVAGLESALDERVVETTQLRRALRKQVRKRTLREQEVARLRLAAGERDRHAAEARRLRDEHALEAERLREEHASQRQRLRDELVSEAQRLRNEHAAETQRLQEESASAVQRLRDEHAAAAQRLADELAGRDAVLAAREQKIAELGERAHDLDVRLKRRAADVAAKEQTIAKHEAAIKKARREAQELSAQLERQRDRAGRLDGRVERLVAQLAEREASLKTRVEQLEALTAAQANAQKEIEALSAELEAVRGAMTALTAAHTEAEAELDTLRRDAVALRALLGSGRVRSPRFRFLSHLGSWVIRMRIDLMREAVALRRDPAFDGAAYAARYPDVALSGASALLHYIEHGKHEGRDARPWPALEAPVGAHAATEVAMLPDAVEEPAGEPAPLPSPEEAAAELSAVPRTEVEPSAAAADASPPARDDGAIAEVSPLPTPATDEAEAQEDETSAQESPPPAKSASAAGTDDRLRLLAAIREVVEANIPGGATVAVVTRGDAALLGMPGRRAIHFPQTEDGAHRSGTPRDGTQIIGWLDEARRFGAQYLVIPRDALSWLGQYRSFINHLDRRCELVVRDDACAIFSLASAGSAGRAGSTQNGSSEARAQAQVLA